MALKHGWMLACADKQHIERRGVAPRAKRGGEREISRFGRSARENHAAPGRAYGLRDGRPRFFKQRLGRPPFRMDRGRIAERLQRREHRRPRFGAQRGGGVVVEIDAAHGRDVAALGGKREGRESLPLTGRVASRVGWACDHADIPDPSPLAIDLPAKGR